MRKIEDKIQCEVIKFCRQHKNLELAFHVDNGKKNTVGEAMQAKRMGRLAGVPDLCIPMSNNKTLWLELKTKTGKVSPVQEAIHEKLKSKTHNVVVAYGLAHALEILGHYV